MNFLILILLIFIGGGMGGFASAIAQENEGHSYKIRLPFLMNKDKTDSLIINLGCLGNILTGAAASMSLFFIVGSLFNLEPNSFKNEVINTENQPSFSQLLQKEPLVFSKLFSLSIAAGFAGIPLMELLANQVLIKVDSNIEEIKNNTQEIAENTSQEVENQEQIIENTSQGVENQEQIIKNTNQVVQTLEGIIENTNPEIEKSEKIENPVTNQSSLTSEDLAMKSLNNGSAETKS